MNKFIKLFEDFKGEPKLSYSTLVRLVSQEKGIPVVDINKLLYKIAWHETGGTLSPKQTQLGGGPGRGLYQYEPDSLKVALNRVDNYLSRKRLPKPDWISVLKGKYDATILSAKQQSFIALIDLLERSNFDIIRATKSDKNLAEEWGRGWNTKNDPAMIKKFLEDITKGFYREYIQKSIDYLGK